MNIFPQITSPPQASAEVLVNQALSALDVLAVYAFDPNTSAALVWGYLPGRWGGIVVAAGTLTLTASGDNYITVNRATGAVGVDTTVTNWNDALNYARVYKVTCDASGPTTIEDHRVGPGGVIGIRSPQTRLQSVSIAGGATVTLTAAQAACDILELSGAKTANLNVVVPNAVAQWTVFNNSTGAFTMTIKTAAGTGIVIANAKRAIVYSNGANVVRVTADT